MSGVTSKNMTDNNKSVRGNVDGSGLGNVDGSGRSDTLGFGSVNPLGPGRGNTSSADRGSADDPAQANFLPPMAGEGIHAGFPSPAQDYMNPCIDLNKELVRHPAATFYGRVVGDSMVDAGVEEGDILVIDKSIEATEGDMCVCFVDGEFTLKYLSFKDPSAGEKSKTAPVEGRSAGMRSKSGNTGNAIWLIPANPAYPPIKVSDPSFSVWGVVTYVIKKTYRK